MSLYADLVPREAGTLPRPVGRPAFDEAVSVGDVDDACVRGKRTLSDVKRRANCRTTLPAPPPGCAAAWRQETA
jgi:hypothetical protein